MPSVTIHRTVFGDPSVSAEKPATERDWVVLRWTLQGNHRGRFMGIRLIGTLVTIAATIVSRLGNTRMAEYWENVEGCGLLRRLGGVVTVTNAEE